jgi:hypothetical protein
VNSRQLDLWPEDVGALPWGGRSPRMLAKEIVSEKLRNRPCGVDNSLVRCPSREALRIGTDPAQYQLCVSTSFEKEV